MIIFYLLTAILPLTGSPFFGRQIGGLTLFKLIGGLCIFVALLRMIRTLPFGRFIRSWPGRWFLLYVLVEFLGYVARGGRLTMAPGVFSNLLSILGLFFVAVALVDNLGRLRWVILISIGAAALSSLAAIHQWWVYHNIYPGFRSWGGLSLDDNSYALIVSIWFPLAFVLMIHRRPLWERGLAAACFFVIGIGMTLSASRGGMLGLAASVLVLTVSSRRRVLLLVLCAILFVGMAIAPSSPIKRLIHPSHSDRESTAGRIDLWKVSLNLFSRHPLFGAGAASVSVVLYETLGFHVTHNTYLDLAAELGLAGLIPFLGIVISSFWVLAGLIRRNRSPGTSLIYQYAVGMQAGLVAFAVSACFISAWWERTFWFLVFLVVSFYEIERAMSRASRTAAPLPAKADATAAKEPGVLVLEGNAW